MISEDMVLLDIVSEYPEAEAVFHGYDALVGKCILCSNLFDTVDKVAKEYGLNKVEMIGKLNKL
ncbi:MAG: hypothetical protein PHQ32_06705 [Firmicutes bacterium]|nr:hypothetical protein [Bacillota bacterium]